MRVVIAKHFAKYVMQLLLSLCDFIMAAVPLRYCVIIFDYFAYMMLSCLTDD